MLAQAPEATALEKVEPVPEQASRPRLLEERSLLLGIESLQDYALFLLDPEGRVTTWNRGAERIQGYQTHEIVGKHFSLFYGENDVPSGKCERELDVATREGRFEDEGWRVRKDGTAFWAAVVITAVRDAEGKLSGFVKVTRDLTEPKKAVEHRRNEQAARAASEASLKATRFLAQASETLAATLEYQATLQAVAGVAVPVLADDCALDVVDPDGSIRRAAEAPPQPKKRRLQKLLAFPPGPTRRGPTELIVPLRARGKFLGAITFSRVAEFGRQYSHADIGLAEELARRAALAIDNALLFRAQVDATERTTRLQRTTAALAEVRTVQEAGRVVIEQAQEAFGAGTATLYLLEKGGRYLRYLAAVGDLQKIEQDFPLVPMTADSPIARSVRQGCHYFLESHEQLWAESSPAIVAAINLALRVKGRAIGSLVLSFTDPRPLSEQDRQFAEAWAQQCAQALDRALLLERERKNGERAAFLARAGELLASSLDPEKALQDLAQLVVPKFGDWCAVELVDGDSSRPLAVAHTDPEKAKWASELGHQARGTLHVIDSGKPELYAEIPEQLLKKAAKHKDQLEMLGKLGMRSAALVPLIASGKCLGAISLYWAETGNQYDQSDVEFFMELAHRAAQALERARLLRAERESERRFRFLADHLPQIVWTAKPDGYTDYYNERWYEFTGFEQGRGGEDSWTPILHPDDLQLFLAAWHRSVQTGEPFQIEYRFIDRRTGSHRWFLGQALPFRDEQGRVKKWFGSCTDIQDQKEAAEKLGEALRVREEFLAIAGHELRTPLAALLMHVHSLQRAAEAHAPSVKLNERLEKASSAGARLENLLNQMLDVSRIHAGELRLEPESFELDGLLRDVVERFSEQAASAHSPISLGARSHLPGLWDRLRIDQVLSNLIANAIKYGHGKPIEVSLSTEAGEAVIRVTDRGIGIDVSQQVKIFERFEHAVGTREFGGLGIGLWISRQIVESSGGRIEVESTPGQGSTFTIRLPVRPEEVQHVVH